MAGGALAQYGYILPYSRKHESEADYIGLLLAADAGYDPEEAIRVWQRMEQMSQKQPPQFLSTHPSHGTRIKQMTE
jgi:predicted Zn-dependent protease